ncbi:ATP-binding protein [Streptomyces varsoviensis]|uniref:DNA-directed RNA polymerase II n=1 Tax=Streptomyces varsoviensis TaxID=67373 RepID=A0ABR5J2L1_9ACTN|nr:ATP-binding protein [Streptomyces varsoviensis]KOG87635.1 DNA-directed RNA polymerase II [Streptomyces varsoviensis]
MCPSTATAEPPRPDFSLVFPPRPGWVHTARQAMRTALAAAGRADLVDVAVLLTSEAVTNAVNACIGSGCSVPVTLYAEWDVGGSLRVLVHDGAPGLPKEAPGLPKESAPSDARENGRGLLLIGACASEWGVCAHGPGPGKAVWFQLAG